MSDQAATELLELERMMAEDDASATPEKKEDGNAAVELPPADGETSAADIEKEILELAGTDENGDELPAKTPEELAAEKKAKEEAAGKIEGATEADLKDLPTNLTPETKTLFIKERIKNRKEREAVAEPERKPEPAAAAAAEADREPTEQEYLTALDWAAQAQAVIDGAYRPDLPEEKAREVAKAAAVVISSIKDPVLLAKLRDSIVTGKATLQSDASELLGIIEKEVPFVSARAQQQATATAETQKQAQEMTGQIASALKDVYEQFPAFKPPAQGEEPTKEHLFGLQYMKEMPAEDAVRICQDPKTAVPKLWRRIRAEFLLEQNEATAAELAALKKRITKSRTPLSGGGSAGGGAGSSTGETAADVKKQIADKFPGLDMDED